MSVVNLRNKNTISARVAEVLTTLKKGHSRGEAFKALNDANILDRQGKRIVPSVWYHSLTQVVQPNGKTFMQEHYPKFVATASPYPRENVRSTQEAPKAQPAPTNVPMTPDMRTLERIKNTLAALTNEIASFLPASNAIHASIHAADAEIGQENQPRRRTG